MKLPPALVAGLVASLIVACDQKPKSYEECILQSLQPGQSQLAVREIRSACYKLYPKN